jgi:hypothetical protein
MIAEIITFIICIDGLLFCVSAPSIIGFIADKF